MVSSCVERPQRANASQRSARTRSWTTTAAGLPWCRPKPQLRPSHGRQDIQRNADCIETKEPANKLQHRHTFPDSGFRPRPPVPLTSERRVRNEPETECDRRANERCDVPETDLYPAQIKIEDPITEAFAQPSQHGLKSDENENRNDCRREY